MKELEASLQTSYEHTMYSISPVTVVLNHCIYVKPYNAREPPRGTADLYTNLLAK